MAASQPSSLEPLGIHATLLTEHNPGDFKQIFQVIPTFHQAGGKNSQEYV